MEDLLEKGIVSKEIKCGNNFAYILEKDDFFEKTYYKMLQNKNNDMFVPCMKMLYNGAAELYYVTEKFRPLSEMFDGILPDVLINVILNLFEKIIEVRNIGILPIQCIDISWDKIFVEPSTLRIKLVYLPVEMKIFNNDAEFESVLKSNLVRLINKIMSSSNDKLDRFFPNLCNGAMSIENIYNQYRRVPGTKSTSNSILSSAPQNRVLKLVSLNLPQQIMIELNKPRTIIGRGERNFVDVALNFNRTVSDIHCYIFNENGKYSISDREGGSTNGTFVNKKRLMPNDRKPIKSGDVIRVANRDGIDFRLE